METLLEYKTCPHCYNSFTVKSKEITVLHTSYYCENCNNIWIE